MDPKSTVVKSKSSNSAITKKSKEDVGKKYNKKSRSNANFPHHGLKKRGVYVEKRSTKINLLNNVEEVNRVAPKPPPRPRPGQKKFLASVLNILSKSTTGTQYPEFNDHTEEGQYRGKGKTKTRLQKTPRSDDKMVTEINDSKNNKEKFKSRVLSKNFVREDKKKTVVLQFKKDISQTPSNYSDWSNKDSSQISKESNLVIYDDPSKTSGKGTAEELKNAVLEGRNIKEKKLRYLAEEPKTLVANGPKDQKNLYNFFVDLLETTISVYNVKTEYDPAGPSDESNINLRINESVAKKLNIDKTKKRIEFADGNETLPLYNIQDETNNFLTTKPKPTPTKVIKREVPPKPAKSKRLNTESIYSNTAKKIPQKSKSVEIRRKTMFKNKSDLINVLKQELELTSNVYEEPRSIFQALRVMARNKKKISFDPSLHSKTLTDECDLRRRKVISSRKMRKYINHAPVKNNLIPVKPAFNRIDYIQDPRKYTDVVKKASIEVDGSESHHSLEVYGFDYEPKSFKEKTLYLTKSKDVTFMYHSSPSNSDLEFEVQDAILNPTVTMSSIRKFSAVVD